MAHLCFTSNNWQILSIATIIFTSGLKIMLFSALADHQDKHAYVLQIDMKRKLLSGGEIQ